MTEGFRSKRLFAAEESEPAALCGHCPRTANINYGRHGWLCWCCYEERRVPMTAVDIELERRLGRRA